MLGLILTGFYANGAPANDDFANRTVLTGNDVVFTGDLTGSTIEANEPTNPPGLPFNTPPLPGFPATNSVWWTWTAAETAPVTIGALNYSVDTYLPNEWTSALAVYAGTNIFGSPPATTTNAFWLEAGFNHLALTFPAVAGTSYQVQFFGTHPTLAVTFRLVATNSPVILDPPAPQTVFPAGSALFTVTTAGVLPVSYQWQFDGGDLPGQTFPMLALDNIPAEQAGSYAVVVSNATGVVTSAPTALRVSAIAAAPLLAPTASPVSDRFGFTLSGEAGRYYRIQSSTDLVNWGNETNFSSIPVPLAYPPGGGLKSSVVYAETSNLALWVSSSIGPKFVRAVVYMAPNEICNNNLKQIRFAKGLWIRTLAAPLRDAEPVFSDLQPEILGLYCPVFGSAPAWNSYLTQDMMNEPICMIVPDHILEEPR